MTKFAMLKILEGLVLCTSDELQSRLQEIFMWLRDQPIENDAPV